MRNCLFFEWAPFVLCQVNVHVNKQRAMGAYCGRRRVSFCELPNAQVICTSCSMFIQVVNHTNKDLGNQYLVP